MNKDLTTPTEDHPELAKAVGVPNLYFKREDQGPYGSHKGRSIPVMIEYYYGKGDRSFAISSSGNAAIAAALYVKEINSNSAETMISGKVELQIFVGNNISKSKLSKIENLTDDNIKLFKKERPLQALMAASDSGMRSLRQSTDDIALLGYKSLAEELSKIKNVSSIFIGTSSGTTAQALAQYFTNSKNKLQVHIVQTSSCHHIAEEFEHYDGPNEKSIADAIVDQTAFRKPVLVPLISQTGGHGWIVTNEDIETAKTLIKKHTDSDISTNSAISVAGLMKAVYSDWKIDGAAICIICGE